MQLKDIDRPLGQDLPRTDGAQRESRLTRKSVISGVVVLGLVAASAAIALRPDGFRQPVTPVENVAAAPASAQPAPGEGQSVVADLSEPDDNPVASVETTPGGASIIKIKPSQPRGQNGGIVVLGDPAAQTQNLRVAHLPDRAMLENSDQGPLPARAADGRRPFDVYARPWSGARGARVAIVIGGLAVSQTGTQDAINRLPPEVTLAFASQGNSIGRWMQAARQRGHEILMQLPLEPFDYPNVNPGKSTLTVDASPQENAESLHWVLSRTTNYTGVMNYMGARFIADPKAMEPLLTELGQRGLLFLDDGTTGRSKAQDIALRTGTPFAEGDTVIDDVQDRGAILKKLDQLEATARAKGFALGTGSAFGATIEAVITWVNEAKKRGIEIVPVSAIANDPERS